MPALIQLILMVAVATTEPTSAPATQPSFPHAWIGRWTGPAVFESPGGKRLEFQTELTIEPTDNPDRFKWEIVYVDEGKYDLVAVDAAKGKYQIDEKSSIVLDASFVNGGLYCQFIIENLLVTGQYRLVGDTLTMELITTDPTKSRATGGENDVPIVTSNQLKGVQRSQLRRAAK